MNTPQPQYPAYLLSSSPDSLVVVQSSLEDSTTSPSSSSATASGISVSNHAGILPPNRFWTVTLSFWCRSLAHLIVYRVRRCTRLCEIFLGPLWGSCPPGGCSRLLVQLTKLGHCNPRDSHFHYFHCIYRLHCLHCLHLHRLHLHHILSVEGR